MQVWYEAARLSAQVQEQCIGHLKVKEAKKQVLGLGAAKTRSDLGAREEREEDKEVGEGRQLAAWKS